MKAVDTALEIAMPRLLTKMLTTGASLVSIGFGVWHFFVPKIWNWYSYMDAAATELIVAVRAINVFFSLSLVLFGLVNLFLVFDPRGRKYPLMIVLGASCAFGSSESCSRSSIRRVPCVQCSSLGCWRPLPSCSSAI